MFLRLVLVAAFTIGVACTLVDSWRINQAARLTVLELAQYNSTQLLFPCMRENPVNFQIDSIPAYGEQAFLYAGYSYLLRGECEQAVAIWENSLSLSGGNETTLFRLGLVYLQLGETEKAHELFRQLDLSKRQKLPDLLTTRGASSVEEALGILEISFWVYPSRTTTRRLDRQLAEAGRGGERQFYYDKLVELAPTDTFDYWWGRGEIAYRQSQWLEAARAFYAGLAVTADTGNRHWLYLGLTNSFRQLGDDACANYFRMVIDNRLYDEPLRPDCRP